MKLEQMQQIIAIEKNKSISKTAKALYIAQPSLSASLNSFEQEIGVKIFERNSLGVAVSEQGADILALAKEVMSCVDRMTNYNYENGDLIGEAVLYCTPVYGFLFSEVLLAFKKRFPRANLRIVEKMPLEIVEDIQRGLANIGLATFRKFSDHVHPALQDKHIKDEIFGTYRAMLYVNAGSHFAMQESVVAAELRDEQFVVHESAYWEDVTAQVEITKPPLIMKDRENLKRLVADGHAVALMLDIFAINDIYCQYDLIKLVPLTENITAEDHLMSPKGKALTVLEQGVHDILRETLKRWMDKRT